MLFRSNKLLPLSSFVTPPFIMFILDNKMIKRAPFDGDTSTNIRFNLFRPNSRYRNIKKMENKYLPQGFPLRSVLLKEKNDHNFKVFCSQFFFIRFGCDVVDVQKKMRWCLRSCFSFFHYYYQQVVVFTVVKLQIIIYL